MDMGMRTEVNHSRNGTECVTLVGRGSDLDKMHRYLPLLLIFLVLSF